MACSWLSQNFNESHFLPLGPARYGRDIADGLKKSPSAIDHQDCDGIGNIHPILGFPLSFFFLRLTLQ